MARYIKLELGSLSVTLDRFVDEAYPRILAQAGELSRTADGNLIVFGSAVEDPHLWEFSAYVSHADRDKLSTLYNEHQRLRRTFQEARITVTDTTAPYIEAGTRTRAKAPAPFDTESAPFAGFVSYYARYYAFFAAPPEFTHQGKFVNAAISLQETAEIVTP